MTAIMVSCRQGAKWLTSKTLMARNKDETYEELFGYLKVYSNLNFDIDDIDKVMICNSKREKDSVNVSSITLPLSTGLQLDFNMVTFELKTDVMPYIATPQPGPSKRNAFELLMHKSAEMMLPLKIVVETNRKIIGPEKLYNDLVDFADTKGAGWSVNSQDSGVRVIKTLRNVLWYVDNNHEKFAKQGAAIPTVFSSFQNIRDLKLMHKGVPQIQYSRLCELAEDLNGCLTLPSMTTKQNSTLAKCMEQLMMSIMNYRDHLKQDVTKRKESHQNMSEKESNDSSVLEITRKSNIDKVYINLHSS